MLASPENVSPILGNQDFNNHFKEGADLLSAFFFVVSTQLTISKERFKKDTFAICAS